MNSFYDFWKNEVLFEKLEPGFWNYGWIRLLGPSSPNVVSRPQIPGSRNFLRFNKFIGFISWFLRKWGPACESWSQDSGLMARYVFWAQVAHGLSGSSDPMPQGQNVFWDFMILLIYLIIFGKMRSCLWKMQLGFLNNGLVSPFPNALGLNCSKLFLRPQTPNVRVLESENVFMSSSIKFCIK